MSRENFTFCDNEIKGYQPCVNQCDYCAEREDEE